MQKHSCRAIVPFSELCGLLTPSPSWGQRDLKRETDGPGKGSAASMEVLTLSLFNIHASFATGHPKDKGHLSPCPPSPISLGLKMDSQDHTSSSRSSLSAFFSRPSRDWNRAFQYRKHLMASQQGQSCVLASQCSLLLGKGHLNQQRAASRCAWDQTSGSLQPQCAWGIL